MGRDSTSGNPVVADGVAEVQFLLAAEGGNEGRNVREKRGLPVQKMRVTSIGKGDCCAGSNRVGLKGKGTIGKGHGGSGPNLGEATGLLDGECLFRPQAGQGNDERG